MRAYSRDAELAVVRPRGKATSPTVQGRSPGPFFGFAVGRRLTLCRRIITPPTQERKEREKAPMLRTLFAPRLSPSAVRETNRQCEMGRPIPVFLFSPLWRTSSSPFVFPLRRRETIRMNHNVRPKVVGGGTAGPKDVGPHRCCSGVKQVGARAASQCREHVMNF